MPDEIERARVAARGDRANVPEDGPSRVEIGCLDKQQAAFFIFGPIRAMTDSSI